MQKKFLLLTFLWAAVILVLTLLPKDDMPETPDWETLSFDKVAHAGVYFILIFLMIPGLREQRWVPALRHNPVLPALLISVTFGGMIEVAQTALAWGRQGSLLDVVSNTVGCLLGIGAYHLARHRRLFGLS